jgi:CHAD domain-containing protein/predicted phosphodiesterase
MRVAILSDIHGNILALDAVLDDLAAQGGADTLVVAGDLCLDGPRPREVLERLQALGYPIVQGNTDRDLAHSSRDAADTPADDWHAALFNWTREQIGPAGLDYLAALPFSHRVPDPTGETALLVVHANPRDLDTHLRPAAPEEAILPLLADLADDITTLAFGHLHIPYTRRVGDLLLANISSVGLPKDGDRRAGYGLLTWGRGGWQVEQRRVEYPVDEVVAQWRAADPPGAQEIIRLLLRARYPNMTEARGGRLSTRRTTRPAVAAPAAAPVPSTTPEAAPTLVTPAQAPEADLVPAKEAYVALVSEPVGEPDSPLDTPSAPEAAPSVPEAKPPKPAAKRPDAKKKAKRAAQPEFAAADNFPWILPRLLEERLAAVLAPMATVREDEDPEGVHDMRVAIRRLRGALEPAEPFYPPKTYKRALRRVKALARSLGAVRDADVHLITLRKRLNRAAPDEQAGIAGLIDNIVADRVGSRADLDPVLDRWEGPNGAHLVEVRDLLARARGRKQKDRTRDSVAAVALRSLSARLEELGDAVGILATPDRGDAEEFHEVRIIAKRLRYTLELFSPVLGPDIDDLLAELKTLQDLLGELHDRDVLIDLLQLERVGAAERQLDALARSALEPGSRANHLASVRAELADPGSFAATATGIYGLLIDVLDERASLETQTRDRWATLFAAGFLDRLWNLTDGLRHALDALTAPAGEQSAAAPVAADVA